MGNYVTQADVEKQVTSSGLIELTDDANAGLVDTANLDAAIANAEGEADGYLGKRYTTPLSPVPAVVKALAVDITVYRLYGRRHGAPEDVERRYRDAIRFFTDVAKGVVSLGVESPAPDNSGSGVDIESDAGIFKRSDMDGF